MSGQSGGHRLRLSKLNDQLTCKLCSGYFIDATTIIECLHSFCRSCIVKYLENNKYCPICEVQVHKSRPLLNIRPDHTLQDIVYKLVPGCYQNEMRCRREFYSKHPEVEGQASSPEARGEPTESHIYSPDESLSLSLEYFNSYGKETAVKEISAKPLLRRYLRCPAAVTIFHLQKLIRAKYGLTDAHRVDVLYKEEPLCSNYSLMDVMYIYHWRRKVPLHLSYRIFESSPKRIKLSEDNVNYKTSLMSVGIDSIESRDEKSAKRGWKEVQLKISETGVMSIMDISDQQFKRSTRIESSQERRCLEETVPSLETVKAEAAENSDSVKDRKKSERPVANSDAAPESDDSKRTNQGTKKPAPEENKAATKPKEAQELKNHVENNNVSVKEESRVDADQRQSPKNNNNTIGAEGKLDTLKNAKNADVKAVNAGSKIDALSAKLQFQPKIGQVGNTYSKKAPKEKKPLPQTKKLEPRTSEGPKPETKNSVEAKARTNCATSPKAPTLKSNLQKVEDAVGTSEAGEKQPPADKNAQVPGHDRCTNAKEQKANWPETRNAAGHPQNEGESLVPTISVPTSTNQTFPYTVQDLVNNAMLKGSFKNLASLTKLENCAESVASMTSQLNVPSMSIHTAPKNAQGAVAKPKVSFEVTGVYSVPPCPDAIPISLMKPTIRKNELITKGSNLNDICAKIGGTGSKINDICAKIGENSKEKNKTETRKSDIPDLLKIGRSPSTEAKHAQNIPNVPVYAPSNSTVTENKSVYSNVKDSLRATSLVSTSPSATPHAPQKVPGIRKQSQVVGYKTLRDPPRCWNPTLSKNNYVAVKNQKETQNQPQTVLSERSKPIQSKPAKIFKMRTMPRYLGNPASGVKPMYGIGSETKEKEQSATTTNTSKSSALGMMKIDPKTLSPIVSTVNSPIVSPPPYSPSARNYQNTPYSREMCRSTGSPISPKNSPVNMLSTNPFIPSPTPNTNPRLIYSHFPPPFPDASRFPNPLIRSPIGIPPPSAFHSSLPPSINKLYQRSSYMPQTTGFSPVSQPPTVQRIPPSTYSSPKSPKTTSLTAISPTSYSLAKSETQLTITSLENNALAHSENAAQEDLSVFNLSKTATSTAHSPSFSKTEAQVEIAKPGSPAANVGQGKQSVAMTTATTTTTTSTSKTRPETPREEKGVKEDLCSPEKNAKAEETPKETSQVNGDLNSDSAKTQKVVEKAESEKPAKEEKTKTQDGNLDKAVNKTETKSEELGKNDEQFQEKSEVTLNKVET